MRLSRIVLASALLFGAGCMLPGEEYQAVDPASLDDSIGEESAALLAEDQVSAVEADGELLGSNNDYWVCWYCYEYDDHDSNALEGQKECPEEYCYHGKHKKKGKAKDKAEDACEDDYEYDCYFKYCKEFE